MFFPLRSKVLDSKNVTTLKLNRTSCLPYNKTGLALKTLYDTKISWGKKGELAIKMVRISDKFGMNWRLECNELFTDLL